MPTASVTKAREILESAIRLYLETLGEQDLIVTGWIVTVAATSPDDEHGRYTQATTPGMQSHVALGLAYKGVEMVRR